MKRIIITIGREYGSGGRLVAQQLSDKLEIPFYDKELISGPRTALSTISTALYRPHPSPSRCLSPRPR